MSAARPGHAPRGRKELRASQRQAKGPPAPLANDNRPPTKPAESSVSPPGKGTFPVLNMCVDLGRNARLNADHGLPKVVSVGIPIGIPYE
jgi:hypothetical protein